MPQTSQGDIFEAATRVQLAIIFGHIGFNEMQQRWRFFAQRQIQLSDTRDPFTKFGGNPVEWSEERWLWFVREEENHGMTEAQLTMTLDSALAWASKNQIASVATNGIADTNHGHNTAANRCSDDNRAAWLKNYVTKAEKNILSP